MSCAGYGPDEAPPELREGVLSGHVSGDELLDDVRVDLIAQLKEVEEQEHRCE